MGSPLLPGRSGTLCSGEPGNIPSGHSKARAPLGTCIGWFKEPTWTYLEVAARSLLRQATTISNQKMCREKDNYWCYPKKVRREKVVMVKVWKSIMPKLFLFMSNPFLFLPKLKVYFSFHNLIASTTLPVLRKWPFKIQPSILAGKKKRGFLHEKMQERAKGGLETRSTRISPFK